MNAAVFVIILNAVIIIAVIAIIVSILESLKRIKRQNAEQLKLLQDIVNELKILKEK